MSYWAIVGKGFIYPRHEQAIERIGDKILLTCDIDPSKNPDYTDWCQMRRGILWKDVTHVAICTPNYLHYPMAWAMSDKIVLCEKPLTISSDDAKRLIGSNVNGVLQLRHHPKLQGLKPKQVSVTAKMFRDESYWNGWKGNQEKSGGVLFNLGIHYIDLLIWLMGNPIAITNVSFDSRFAAGEVIFENGKGTFHIEILDNREGQIRKILVDGKEVSLSDKDNLSYEDLHYDVYKALKEGKGIKPEECLKSIKLVEQIYAFPGM